MSTIFSIYCFQWLQTQCQEVRKRKELELQILTESIRLWEGEDIKTFGSVIYMSQAMVQNQGCEVRYYSNEHFLSEGNHLCLCIRHSVRIGYFIQELVADVLILLDKWPF